MNDATTNSFINKMRMLQRTVFINKMRLLQQMMLQRTVSSIKWGCYMNNATMNSFYQ